MILVGDIGGTKTRMALYERKDKKLVRKEVETFASSDFTGLEEILRSFLNKRNIELRRACFGVPGPIVNGEAQATNLPWRVTEQTAEQILNIKRVKLVNDLVATASAIPYLSPEELQVLYKGKSSENSHAPRVILAPGTGLGQAFLVWHSGKYRAYPAEGGHIDFAPTNDLEIELFRYLKTKYPRVSYERILCGPGLKNIYDFLKHINYASEPDQLKERMQKEDPAAVISTTGQSGEFEICKKALDLFISMLGVLAGNLVFSYLATGGIYLGGGIPPKILNKLSDGTFVDIYLNRGRLSYLVKETPLAVIKDDHAALLGAASIANSL